MSGVTPKVLFLVNEHLATEALLGDAFIESGYDVDTFDVVPAEHIDSPAVEVTFPDPTGYDVIVPLGARWPCTTRRCNARGLPPRQSWCATPPAPESHCWV